MIAKRLLAIQKASYGSGGGGVVIPSTDVYYDYRSLILNMQGSAGSTTFTDSSPNNFTVTPYGNAQLASDATFGTVASFDGNGDYLTVANNAAFNFGSGDFTVEFWFYNSNAAAQNNCLISLNDNNNYYAGLRVYYNSTNTLDTLVSTNGTSWSVISNNAASNSVVKNVWNHYAVVRSGGLLKTFLNGTQYMTDKSITGSVFSSSSHLIATVRSGSPLDFFNGLIGPLRISPWAVYKSDFTPSQDLFPAAPDSTYANPYYDKVALQLKFDGTNGSTSFVDTGPNAFAVTPSGNAQITSASKYGSGAGAFDGNGDYLLAPGANGSFAFGTSPFTIEFWMLANDITSRQGLFSNNINSSSGLNSGPVFAIRGLSTTGKLGVGNVGQADKVQTPENVITVGNWHHIALVREGIGTNQTKIYVDGITQGTGTMSDNYNVARDAGVARTLYYSEYFNGSIDELEITPGVAKYKANFTPPVRGLSTIYNPYTTLPVSGAALWLDGADSSTLFTDAGVTPVAKSGDLIYQWSDKSGNNRHATQATSGNRPTWLPPASGQNGFGAVKILGATSSQSMTATVPASIWNSPFSVFLVFVNTAANSNKDVFIQGAVGTGQYRSVWISNSSPSKIAWSQFASVLNMANTVNPQAYAISLSSDAQNTASINAITNSTSYSGTVSHTSISSNTLYLGGFGSPADYVLCEMAVFPSQITSGQLTSLNNYAKAKWGTP